MNFYRYFQAYLNYFWQWEDHTQVVSIPNGNTIIYRELMLEMIEYLAPQGLPTFGNLLLVTIATNPNAEQDLNQVGRLVREQFLKKGSSKHNFVQTQLPQAIAFLKNLIELPEQYKQGKGRLLLFQSLFEKGHNLLSERKNRKIVETLKMKSFDTNQLSLQKEIHPQAFHNDFRQFQLLYSKYPDTTAILNLLSDLPELEELIELEETTDQVYEHFVDELADHDRTFQVGALIRQLWSGLAIPYHHSLPSQQPLGGVSDITNKGEYSRLLISEFANDDLIFMSRLANNEALFLNREVPPQSSSLERVILVDASVKSWGTPKTVAHAIMIAIAQHPKTDIHCEAYAIGKSYYPLGYNSVDEVISGLLELDACLHPAEGLNRYFHEHKKRASEVILITSTETLQQASFQQVLGAYQQELSFIIQTDDQGGIDVFRRLKNSKKHVQHIQLPLARLWERKPKKQPKEIPSEQNPMQSSYPILFPTVSSPKGTVLAKGQEVYQLTDKCLLQLDGSIDQVKAKGWTLVYENLPVNGDGAIGKMENGDKVLLLFKVSTRKLYWINLTTGEQQQLTFKDWKSSVHRHLLFYNGVFNYIRGGMHWEISANPTLSCELYKNDTVIHDVHKEYGIALAHAKAKVSMDYTILKNVKEVFINQRNNLVFNQHELICSMRGIRLQVSYDQQKVLTSISFGKKKNEFKFPNGSIVSMNRLGMITLSYPKKQGSDTRSCIYIPTILDRKLGVATDEHFTGNSYFLPKNHQTKPMNTADFYKKYIQSFINEAKNETPA